MRIFTGLRLIISGYSNDEPAQDVRRVATNVMARGSVFA